MVRLATWNVNSLKARIGHLTDWLRDTKPDVVMLQEIKCQEDAIPRLELEDLGYNVAAVGQKSYNGVALLSRHPLTVERRALPGDEGDVQARYIEGLVELPAEMPDGGGDGAVLRVASIYLPNGNPVESEKYPYKLAWLDRLRAHVADLLTLEERFVLGGDYNIAPTDEDVYDPVGWRDDALCRLESRLHYRAVVNLGLTDAYRAMEPQGPGYSFWDYQAGCWPRDDGLRIDHLLLSPQAADRLKAAGVDRGPRSKDRPSDHTPVWCELDL
jgi:exodeoxyribonuclease III